MCFQALLILPSEISQWLGFSKFVTTYGILDDKVCKLSDVDLVFRDVNVEGTGPDDEQNPDGMFILNEFLESLIHLSAESYLKVRSSALLPPM